MPTDAEDLVSATEILTEWAEMYLAPAISPSELDTILTRHKRASWWSVDTAFSHGNWMLPPTRNGWLYGVTQPGTTSSTVPAYTDWPTSYGARFGDGSSSPVLTWEVLGSDWILTYGLNNEINVYDIISAAKECWMLRSRKCANFMQTGDSSFQQVHAQSLKMAETFVPKVFPSRVVRA